MWWQIISPAPSGRYLTPQHGALLSLLPGKPRLHEVTLEALQLQPYSARPIPGHLLSPGAVLAVRTGGGRLVKVRVDAAVERHGIPGYDLHISYHVYPR